MAIKTYSAFWNFATTIEECKSVSDKIDQICKT